MSKPVPAPQLELPELERLRDQVGLLFASLQETAEEVAPANPAAWRPLVDLCETDDAIDVNIELPGMRASQVRVTLSNGRLSISGERKRVLRGRVVHLCSERNYGQFSRTVVLRRWAISLNEATAELQNGVLMVHLPKVVNRRGMEIRVPVRASDE